MGFCANCWRKLVYTFVSHHDVEVDVLAGLFPRKQGEVLGLQLAGVVQDGSRIEASLLERDIISDAYEPESHGFTDRDTDFSSYLAGSITRRRYANHRHLHLLTLFSGLLRVLRLVLKMLRQCIFARFQSHKNLRHHNVPSCT